MDKKATILIVDDKKEEAKLLETILTPEGYETVVVSNGKDALAEASAQEFDAILLDVLMPGMDGFEVTRRLRREAKTRLVPIVLVTALKETEHRIQGIEAGCDDFIVKPFEKNEILARIRTLLKLDFYRRQLDEKGKCAQAMKGLDEGIVICDNRWKVDEMNDSAGKYLPLKGPSQDDLIELFFRNYEVSISREELLGLSTFPKHFTLTRPEGKNTKALHLEVSINALKDHEGNLSSTISMLRDVTARTEEAFAKQNLLDTISHKIRTPILVISEVAQMLSEGVLGELSGEQKDIVQSLCKQSGRLKEVINKLIVFATLYKTKLDSPPEEIDISENLSKIADVQKQAKKERTISVKIECPESLRVNVSKTYFEIVFGHLLENAIKFGDKEEVRIEIRAREIPQGVEFRISDNGPGVPPEEQKKVFDAFYQVEKYFTGGVEGAGLGLTLVKRIIDSYGREIYFQSEMGKGTTFIFTLPKK